MNQNRRNKLRIHWIYRQGKPITILPILIVFFIISLYPSHKIAAEELNESAIALERIANIPITLERLSKSYKINYAENWMKIHAVPAKYFASNIIQSMEGKSVLLVLEDIPTLSLWVLKQKNKIPCELEIYDFDGTYFQSLFNANADILKSKSIEQIFQIRQPLERDLILQSKIPVYCTARRDTADLHEFQLIPSGMLYKFWRNGMQKPDYLNLIDRIKPMDHLIEKYPTIETKNMAAIVRYMRGLNYLQLDTKWAKDSAQREFELSANYAEHLRGIHILLAESFMKLDEPEMAYKSALIAIDKKPYLARAYFLLGELDVQKGNYETAIAHIKKGMQYDMLNSRSYFLLGQAYDRLGDTKNAIKNYSIYITKETDLNKIAEVKARINLLQRLK